MATLNHSAGQVFIPQEIINLIVEKVSDGGSVLGQGLSLTSNKQHCASYDKLQCCSK